MANKIASSLQLASLQDTTPEVLAAANENHHINLGPGQALTDEWVADGLTLPNLDALRDYRVARVREKLDEFGYDGIIVMDPMNIRYVTDATNMQIWVMHNQTRYAWVGADGSMILWEFFESEFLGAHNPRLDEVRPATTSIYFAAGHRYAEKAQKWGAEMLQVIAEHCGDNPRIAIDQCSHIGYKTLEAGGVTIGSGQEVMELARQIKGPDEILAMRCSVHACEATMAEMRNELKPGMTERDVWAMLHAGNIRRGGEWIETQILASGPRTNPWMQEVSSRVIQDGELVGYDTDLVGAYGMMVDVSRTWLCGDGKPNPQQQHVFDLAEEQIHRNRELLQVGASFRDLTDKAWFPAVEDYRHYCVLFHGVGQCDEFPEIFFPEQVDEWGAKGVVEPGMVFTVESFVGARAGGEGVKLEEQILVTDTGPEQLTTFALGLN